MTEFYAKITPLEKGAFRYMSTIWRSHDGIDSVWSVKRFFKINSARQWSEKKLSIAISHNSSTMFIRENDIIRRKWND